MQIRIAVVVGSNNNFAACKFEGDQTDWAFLFDSVGIYNGKDVIYPDAEQRYIITADVDVPDIRQVGATSAEKVGDE